ncbi:MAG: helix-turn-helix domain-containing protein [Desulfovibrio sp.]|nr:helix-turn-helix domain-containing protein [Desulfovibrio sp.]
MTFTELGTALRAEREKRHLSIESVANQLKISPRQLLALEAGDGQSLPHPAYARGFIRSYASFLGFGGDEIQGMLAELQSEDLRKPRPEAAPAPEAVVPERQQRARGGAGWLALLVLFGLAGGAWWAWQAGHLDFLKRPHEKQADILQTLPQADAYLAKKEARQEPPAQREEPQPVIAGLSRPANPIAAIPKARPDGQAELSQAAGPAQTDQPGRPGHAANTGAATYAAQAPNQTPDQTPDQSPDNIPGQTPDQHKLIIVATEECWVHSSADKTDTRQFSLRKGDTFALTFAKSLDLKLGNAGGVRLRYDGRDLPPPGTSGQVKTISFPPKEN